VNQSVRSVAFALVLAFFPLSHSLPASTADRGRRDALDRYFRALVANRHFNGNILVAAQGQIVFERSFGYADFPARRPNTTDIAFPIASVSKVLTATAVLQLAQQNRLHLADAVANYLPSFPYPTITIGQLLSHTSGLPPYNAFFDSLREQFPDRILTNEDFLPGLAAKSVPLLYSPGSKGNYDNINYIVLALVLEKVSGESYSSYIGRHVLEPAGMTRTRFVPLSRQYADPDGSNAFSFPHLYRHLYSETPIRADSVAYVVRYWWGYAFNGFGDYVSTTHDLLRLDQAYYDGRVLPASKQELAFTPVKLTDGSEHPAGYGLGWEIEKDASLGKVVYHSGAATGLSCVLLRDLTTRQTVVVFDNTHPNAHEIASNVLKILNGKEAPIPRKSAATFYVGVLLKQGPEATRRALRSLQQNVKEFGLDEGEMNALGYDLMGSSNPYHFPEEHHLAEALEVFRTNTELFPRSWNVYDSYGEALRKAGRLDDAIRMYERSLELNPSNEGGRKALSEMKRPR
jgi:CubicO group peptidase (beta-lactamase class C family)